MAAQKIYSTQSGVKLYCNIESITGFNNLSDIIHSRYYNELTGIILGRDDMAASMQLDKSKIEEPGMLNLSKIIAEKVFETQKEFIIGGSIGNSSIKNFQEIPNRFLSAFETRKIIFDSSALNIKNINEGIYKALEFEIKWIKNKNRISNLDAIRITQLQERQNKLDERDLNYANTAI